LSPSSCAVGYVSERLRSLSLWLEPDHASNTTHALAVPDCRIGRLLKASIGRNPARSNTARELVRAVRPASLAASARWWWFESAVIVCRHQIHVRFEQVQSASRRCKQEIESFESGGKAVFCYPHLALRREKCSLSFSSRLTLPSRGQLPGYALQLPLMSNVRPQIQCAASLPSVVEAS
jgi:hypothetical protein